MTWPLDGGPQERAGFALRRMRERGASSLLLWQALVGALGEIIGVAGAETLLARSLVKVGADIPLLERKLGDTAGTIEFLSTQFAAQGADEAEQASTALMAHFVATLTVLVGGLVTNRILRSAWDAIIEHDELE